MKAYAKHIDWGKVIATNEIMDRDEEEKANVAKVKKFLAMLESEYARVKDYTKLVVTDGMVDYVLEKYGNKWKSEDEIAYVILEDLWLKYGKDDKGKGKRKLVEDNEKGKEAEHQHLKVSKDDKGKKKLIDNNEKRKVHDIQNRVGSVEVDLARAIKAKHVDDYDDHDLDTLDLENRIKNLKADFGRLLKAKESKKAKKARDAKKAREAELAKQAKKAKEAELKANEEKKEKEEELKAKKAKEAKESMLAELKAKKAKNAKEAMLAEVVQIFSDEDDDEDLTAPNSTRSRAPSASTSIRSRALTAFISIRSRALIASTSNAKAASTTLRGYNKIAMT
uniref:Uncharacterized protein n=1 Tax=Tanacetum cinerariifolium TaxID=118510 RepID=A0A6L2MFT4_TANCI|nr:hypothetical protein [Tanacetum cinerariifolium]